MTLALGDNYESQLLQLLFNGTTIPSIAQNLASGAVTTGGLANLFVALHTADPTTATSASQQTNEVPTTSYTLYARQSVARTSAGWTVTGTSVAPVNPIAFATVPSGTASITASTTSASASLSITATTAGTLAVGQVVSGAGIPSGTYILSFGTYTTTAGTGTVTLSANATATASGVAMTTAGMSTTISATYFSVGTASTGASTILYKGAISPAIPITGGVIPKLAPIATISGSASLLRGSTS